MNELEMTDSNDLSVSIMISDSQARVMLSGVLGFESRKVIKAAYSSLFDNPKVNVILLEMGQVSSITTGGMGILYLMQEHCEAQQKQLSIAHPIGQVKEWLLIANHNNIFNLLT